MDKGQKLQQTRVGCFGVQMFTAKVQNLPTKLLLVLVSNVVEISFARRVNIRNVHQGLAAHSFSEEISE